MIRILAVILIFMAVTRVSAGEMDECSHRLTSSIAVVVDRALTQNKLTFEDVQAMAASDVPLNPLRARIGFSEVGALRSYFELVLPTVSDWEKVRAELREVLVRHGGKLAVRQDAREHTSYIFSGGTFERFYKGTMVERPHRTKEGLIEFSIYNGGREFIYEPGKRDALFDRLSLNRRVPAPVGFEYDSNTGVNGDILVFKRCDNTARSDRLASRDLYLFRPMDGNAKIQWSTEPMRFEYGFRDANRPPIEVAELQDGRFVAAGIQPAGSKSDSAIGFYAPFTRNPGEPLILDYRASRPQLRLTETSTGRVFLVVRGHKGSDNGTRITIYEPAYGDKPLLDERYDDGPADAAVFEREGKLYVSILSRNDRTMTAKLLTYLPLESPAPLSNVSLSGAVRFRGLAQTEHQVYLYLEDAEGVSSYTLFARTRP